jgi:hypothetical protein
VAAAAATIGAREGAPARFRAGAKASVQAGALAVSVTATGWSPGTAVGCRHKSPAAEGGAKRLDFHLERHLTPAERSECLVHGAQAGLDARLLTAHRRREVTHGAHGGVERLPVARHGGT